MAVDNDLDKLQRLLKPDEGAEASIRAVLSKLALDVNSRFQSGSASSAPFMADVIAALKQIQGPDNADLRLNCLIDASHYFYLSGKTFNAIEPAVDAVKLAEEADHKPLLRKAQTFLGIMYADSGNTSQAIECYSQALALSQALRDSEAECSVWVNLGVALLYAAQYRDAISCFEHVIHLAGTAPSFQKFRSAGFSNIALCCLHLEDFARGLKAAEICIRESSEPHTSAELVSRVLKENYYTRLLLEVNSIEKAGERVEIGRRYALQSKSARPFRML